MAVSAEMIKKTQDSLGEYVKKPPLTEKLLSKPPFRFLHDVFTVAINNTGVLEGNSLVGIIIKLNNLPIDRSVIKLIGLESAINYYFLGQTRVLFNLHFRPF